MQEFCEFFLDGYEALATNNDPSLYWSQSDEIEIVGEVESSNSYLVHLHFLRLDYEVFLSTTSIFKIINMFLNHSDKIAPHHGPHTIQDTPVRRVEEGRVCQEGLRIFHPDNPNRLGLG